MGKASILYRNPYLYLLGLKLLHRENFHKRYKYMASFSKRGNSVLEPACGPGALASYLSKGVRYSGFDMNNHFINHALKKNLNVKIGNVLDINSYIRSDHIITCDILHHLNPTDRKKFIKNCYVSTKKTFIVCEPIIDHKNKKNKIITYLGKQFTEWIERDGTNNVKLEYFFNHKELSDLIDDGFGIIPSSVKRVKKRFGEDMVVVFFKN